MTFVKKPKMSASSAVKQIPSTAPVRQPVKIDPVQQRRQVIQQQLQRFTARPLAAQKQALQPITTATQLYRDETEQLHQRQTSLQRKSAELSSQLPPQAIEQALQRQLAQASPASPPRKPQTTGEWVTVMRQQAEQAEGRTMNSREAMNFTALQRQVAQTIVHRFRQDRQLPEVRYAEYGGHLATLQRHPLSGQVARGVMSMLPQGERPALQRAVDEVIQRETAQKLQDEQALELHSLQRQLAELQHEASQPVFERIQARRGSGAPLPEAVQRHLEQGLNYDLSAVRIHDDQEADKLARKVNAIAFTSGQDVYFQSGKFDPNTQTGLELLAHEVTHTVQQSQGKVGKGVDPDSGLEMEARSMGRKLANKKFNAGPLKAKSLPNLAPRMPQAVQRAPVAHPPSWNTTANPAMLEQMIKDDLPGFLRQMLGRTLLDQNHYHAQNRSHPQATPSLGRIFLNSLDHVPVSKESRQKVLDAAIHKPGLPDWVRLEVAKTAVALKRTSTAQGQATIKTLEAKIAKANSMDHIGDFGKAIGSRLVDTVVGIYKLAKFVAWDTSAVRMLVDFPGYKKMWVDIGATGAMIAKNPGLIWDAMTKDARDAWSKGEYGKSLGYITFDVASIATGVPGAARGAATLPGKAKVVLAIAKDARGNMVTRVTEVGDQIAAGMQMTANDLGVARSRPALATANSSKGSGVTQPSPTAVPARSRVTNSLVEANKAKDQAAIALLGRLPKNWPDVRPLIGEKLDVLKLPSGYRVAGQGQETVIFRGTANDLEFAPLTIDPQGNIQLLDPKRLSKPSKMKKNYIGEFGAVPKNHWIHHLLPDNLVRKTQLGAILRKYGYDLDHAGNLYALPNEEAYLKGLTDNPDLIGHWENHKEYDSFVTQEMKSLYDGMVDDYGDLNKLKPDGIAELKKRVSALENKLREMMEKGQFKKKDNGTLAQAEGKGEKA